MRIENSFILAPGVGKKTELKLWKNDVTHWSEFPDNSIVTGKRQKKVNNFLEKAKKNLEVENTHFFSNNLPNKEKWRIYKNFEPKTCFFDIETTGLDQKKNKVTTVTFHRQNETTTLVRGENLTRNNIKEEFFKSKLLVSFNGKRFDQPFLEHNYNLDIETPHIDLMYPCKQLGLSGGLKKIEKELKIQRELEDIDGREAVRLWKQYEKKGDAEALEKLIRYNKYDTVNLKDLMETVHDKLKTTKTPSDIKLRKA